MVTVLEKDLARKRISLSLRSGRKQAAGGRTGPKQRSAAKGKPAPKQKHSKSNQRGPTPFNNPMAEALAKLHKGEIP